MAEEHLRIDSLFLASATNRARNTLLDTPLTWQARVQSAFAMSTPQDTRRALQSAALDMLCASTGCGAWTVGYDSDVDSAHEVGAMRARLAEGALPVVVWIMGDTTIVALVPRERVVLTQCMSTALFTGDGLVLASSVEGLAPQWIRDRRCTRARAIQVVELPRRSDCLPDDSPCVLKLSHPEPCGPLPCWIVPLGPVHEEQLWTPRVSALHDGDLDDMQFPALQALASIAQQSPRRVLVLIPSQPRGQVMMASTDGKP